jgi:hypothetical protein
VLWVELCAIDDVASVCAMLTEGATAMRRARCTLPLFRPEHLEAPGLFARRFFAALAATSAPEAIVLDDYHEVPKHSDLHAALREGLAELPRSIPLVVASREGPPPAFARVAAAGALARIPASALRLTDAEARAVVRLRARHHAVPPGAIRAADGWAAGLVLLAASGYERDLEHAGHRDVFEYLATEAFERLEPRRRAVLLRLSLLPSVEPVGASRLTEDDSAGEILADLARAGWFVDEIRGERAGYRFHDLFRAFLMERGREEFGERGWRELAKRAAAILTDLGDVDAALDLLRGAGAWDALADLVERRASALVGAGRAEALQRLIGALPPEVVAPRPWLGYWRAAASFTDLGARAATALPSVQSAFVAAGDAAGAYRAWAAAVDMTTFAFEDVAPVDEWLDHHDELRARVGPPPDGEAEAAVVAAAIGASANRRPADARLPAWIERALAIALSPGPVRARMNVGRQLMFELSFWCTDLVRARLVIDALRAVCEHPEADIADALIWLVGESNWHVHTGNADRGRDIAAAGLALAERTGVHRWDPLLLSTTAFCELAAADLPAAGSALERMGRAVVSAPRLVLCSYHFTASVVALRRGDDREALERARAAAAFAREGGHPRGEAASLVSAAIAADRCGSSGPSLGEALRACEEARYTYGELGVRLHVATRSLRGGRDGEAVEAVEAALAVAARLECTNSVWIGHDELAELCAFALERGIARELTERVVTSRRLAPGPRARAVAAWPWRARVSALGGLEVAGARPMFPGRKPPRKVLELLRLLIAYGQRGARSATLMDALWPDADGDRAHHALETAVWRLRRLLGDTSAVAVRAGSVALDASRVFVDAWAVELLAARADTLRASGDSLGAIRAAAEASRLYRGDLFGGEGDTAEVVAVRERLAARVDAMRELAERAPLRARA